MRKELSIATVLFTYNRPEHTRLVLESLHRNEILPKKLIIFQDGKKEDSDEKKWNMVNQLICNIAWCDVDTNISLTNKGLANSISHGISDILCEYEAVIVLEDDCVTHPKFMKYMIDALNRYKNYGQIYHINGYSWEADVAPNGYDAYFCGRAGSWGWATWRDRWEIYKEDYKVLSRIKRNKLTTQQLNIWGSDLESYLYGNVSGICDSWATFWAMLIIEHSGFCLTPYKSLVENIGFDGSGVHCGLNPAMRTLMYNKTEDLRLPENIEFPPKYEKIFSQIFKWTSQEKKLQCYYDLLSSWIQLKLYSKTLVTFFQNREIKNIAIWGTGKLCDLLLEEVQREVNVRCLIESNPQISIYRNIIVKKIEDLNEMVQLIIIIPIYDMKNICEQVAAVRNEYVVLGLDEIIKIVMSEE